MRQRPPGPALVAGRRQSPDGPAWPHPTGLSRGLHGRWEVPDLGRPAGSDHPVGCANRQGSAPAGRVEAPSLRGGPGRRLRRNPRSLVLTGRVVPRLRGIDQREQSPGCRQQSRRARARLEDRGDEDASASEGGHQGRCLGCAVPSRRFYHRRLRWNQWRLPLVHEARPGKRVLQVHPAQHRPRS